MFVLFYLSKMDIKYLYTNLFKYLGYEHDRDVNSPINEDDFNKEMRQALTTNYSHVTYNKDEKRFINNII